MDARGGRGRATAGRRLRHWVTRLPSPPPSPLRDGSAVFYLQTRQRARQNNNNNNYTTRSGACERLV